MKSSVSPRFLLTVCAALLCAGQLSAQDTVLQKDNAKREGQILGISGANLKIKIGPVETSIPMAQVAGVTKAAPKAYEDALAAWQTGDANKTLSLLKPVVDNFRGLPTPWAERASGLLGEVYLTLNQVPAAEEAFAAFQKAYPEAGAAADIGLARLAVTKKDFATAKAKLAPVIAEAETVTVAPAGKSAAYGQAFYLMGMVRESEGQLPEALRDYLSAVTLFHEDKAIVAQAQERANVLITEKKVIVP
jgi:tetratricopeptide (TPR) repeat protein